MFGSRVGFSGTADRMALFPVSKNQDGGWPPSWKISNGHISGTGCPIDFLFDPRWGFWGRRIEWTYFRWWKISDGHISGTGRPINFVFDPRVGFSRTADRMDLLPVSPNPRWRLLMTSTRNNRCRNFGAK